MTSHLTGIVPIAVTPFDQEGNVDFDSLQSSALNYSNNGVAGIVIPAVASEVDKLTDRERSESIRAVIEVLSGQIPVIGGVLGETAEAAARTTEEALKMGCHGVLCRAPGTFQQDEQGLREYFQSVASTGVDYLVIQDLSWNDYGMDLSLIQDLFSQIPALRTIKIEVSRTGHKATQVLEATKGKLKVWSGWAMPQMIESLERGIDGYCPSAFNKPFVRVFNLYQEGKKEEAEEVFETLLPYLAWSRQHIDINLHLLKRLCVLKGLFKTAKLRTPCIDFDEYHESYGDRLIERMLEWEKL